MKNIFRFNGNCDFSAIKDSKAVILRNKVNNCEKLTREEKDWIVSKLISNSFYNKCIPVMGFAVDFSDCLNEYIVEQYSSFSRYFAFDKTSIRNNIYGKIDRIIKI